MANTITDFGGFKSIVMSGARFARAPQASIFTGPPDWVGLRVGIRFRTSDTGANLTGTPLFSMGLSSGHAAIPGDATPTHFVGCRHYVSATWTRTAAPTPSYSAGALYASKNVSGSWTDSAGGTIAATVRFHTAYYKALFLDITRSGTTYTLNAFYPSVTAATDVSQTDFYNILNITPTPIIVNHALGTPRDVTVDEGANGPLDHVAVNWSHTTSLLEIADLAVFRYRIP